MAGAPLRTARSSDLSSFRDDYSSWLDEIFPPSKCKNGEQLQHSKIFRQQQENITTKLRNALPMELPQTVKRFVAESATSKHVPKDKHAGEGTSDDKSGQNTLQGSGQPQPQRMKRSSSLSILPVRHRHRRRDRPFEEIKYTESARAPPPRHPATFPDVKYSNGRSSHRPGLSFFEYVPSRAFIRLASTVIFLGPDAARRTGGEVLWLRTNAAGRTQRQIFSSAGCFISSPKLRRRVALSLCGRDERDDAIGTMRASASASGTLRPLHLRARGTGTLPTGTSGGQSTGGIQHPAALLKVYRSCSRHISNRKRSSGSSIGGGGVHGSNDEGPGRKHESVQEKEGGGSTDVLLLDSLSEIEQALLKAGVEGEERLSESRPDTETARGQRQPLPPQQPNVPLSFGGDDRALGGASSEHRGAYQQIESKAGVAPEVGAPEATGAREMTPMAEFSALQLPRRALFGEAKAEVVPRPRPWAIQNYLRPKGPLAWVVRVVWRRTQDSFCWILSSSDPLITSDVFFGGGAPSEASWCNAVRSIAGQTGWEAPKAVVADMVAALESAERDTPTIPLRFDLMAVDLIEDRDGKWWLTQVKAFRLLRPMGTPAPANFILPSSPPPQLVSEISGTDGGETIEGRGNGVGGYGNNGVRKDNSATTQLPRRSSRGDEISEQGGEFVQEARRIMGEDGNLACPSLRIPATFPSAITKTAMVAAAAAAVPKQTRRTERHLRTADLRREMSCPGLYCTGGDEGCEERGQRVESSGAPPASKPRSDRDRYPNAEAAVGEGVARMDNRKNGGTSAQDGLVAPSGPNQENTEIIADGEGPGAREASPMFQIPLKALVVHDEVVRFRRAMVARHQRAAGVVATGGGGRGDGSHVMAQNAARAPSFGEPAWTRGIKYVAPESTSLVESRAITALRRRDRARLYDNVPLCAVCFREYSENWRWWLARGTTEAKTVDGVPAQARAALGPANPRPKLERAGRLRGRAKQSCIAVTAASTTAFARAEGRITASACAQGGPNRSTSSAPSKASLPSQISPRGPIIPGIHNNTNAGSNSSGGGSSSATAASRSGKGRPEAPPPKDGGRVDGASTYSLHGADDFQHQPGRWGREVPQIGAPDAETSTLVTFRARLDRRLEGISIPRASETQMQQDTLPRSSAVSTANTATAAEKQHFKEAASASVVANAEAKITSSRSVAFTSISATEGSPVGPIAAHDGSKKGAPRGNIGSSNKLAQEPADANRTMHTWEWENVTVDWNPEDI